MLKLIIASGIVFFVIILFLFALFPADISVSRVIQIRSSESLVHKKIADLREWKNWNSLVGDVDGASKNTEPDISDSTSISREYVHIDLLKATTDSVITRWCHKNKSFTGDFILTDMNGRVVVQWTLYFHLKWYPWEKLASMFYEKQLGPRMEESLIKLQKELEPAG
jgi:hypothetical protein